MASKLLKVFERHFFLEDTKQTDRPCIQVIFYCRAIKFIFLSGVFSSTLILFSTHVNAIPVGDAYDTGQAEFQVSSGFHPRNEGILSINPSLQPGLNNNINEEHPIPDYIKKISKNQIFPTHYQQLLEINPVDQIQSKVFDEEAFRSVKKIGVLDFENKTIGLFKNDAAGHVLAKQVSSELQSMKNYFIIPPLIMNEDARIRIVSQVPFNKGRQFESSPVDSKPVIPSLPNSNDKVDAVMIGAVTKYINSYEDRDGKIKRSLSSKIEFGSFLVSTRTGDVIWGARFIGSQPTGTLKLGTKWLNKKQLSKRAMTGILKSFRQNDNAFK